MGELLRVKICGVTKADQAKAIAQMGADALGFICVLESPRYIEPEAISAIVQTLPTQTQHGVDLAKIGVFANASLAQIIDTAQTAQLTGIQLHGTESPEFCAQLRENQPQLELIKALRVCTAETLTLARQYEAYVDALLLDAYTPKALGGTGETWDWSLVKGFRPGCLWFLAGGLTPFNVMDGLRCVNPPAIDLSSGVEKSPGDKDLGLVEQLFCSLRGAETVADSLGLVR
jgi:phosphoribosylanthranilate isomerase